MRDLKLVLIVVCLGLCACSSDGESEEKKEPVTQEEEPVVVNDNNVRRSIQLTQAEQQLASKNNDFAFNLFRLVADDVEGKVLSPISITYSLGLLNNGAAGETRQQINEVLGFNSADEVNAFCKKMLTEAPGLDQLTKVKIANTIFVNKGFELKPAFVQKAAEYYDAQPVSRDFHDGKTVDAINQWASDHTEKMIEKVLDEQTFDADMASYLLNAIYFKGAWSEMFDANNTRDAVFHTSSGTAGNVQYQEKTVPMMHQMRKFDYNVTDSYMALCLPYGNNAYRMTILLPNEGLTVSDVLKDMTAKSWKQMQDYMIGVNFVDVMLPRFEVSTNVTLNKIMSQLGMPKAFTLFAEFPDFCVGDVPGYIGTMTQSARIIVNEEGTEGAAVTNTGWAATGNTKGPETVLFHANRPFLYVISEQSTGVIFFIGTFTGQ